MLNPYHKLNSEFTTKTKHPTTKIHSEIVELTDTCIPNDFILRNISDKYGVQYSEVRKHAAE